MTARGGRTTTGVPADAVRAALGMILASGEFRASERLPRFLSFIVEEMLAGRGGRLKGYVIGVEVFDKPPEFDPERDSVVRVEALRLRRALQSYYLGDGRNDPVIISIPKGGYRPRFSLREAVASASGSPVVAGNVSGSPVPLTTRIALGLLLIALSLAEAAYWTTGDWAGADVTGSVTQTRAIQVPDKEDALSATPKIAVLPFAASGMEDNIRIATAFHAQLLSDLTRFDMLGVVAADAASIYFGSVAELQPIAEKYDAQYILSGSIQSDGATVRLLAHLYGEREQRYLWTTRLDRPHSADSALGLQSDLSARVASEIGQIYGVVNRAETRRLIGGPPRSMNSYQCVLGYYDYAARRNAQAHSRIRDCLESAIARNPDYAQAWSALAAIYLDEATLGYNRRKEGQPPLERAKKAAHKAMSLAPDHATGHNVMGRILFATGDATSAAGQLRIALDRNPNDATLLASAGHIFAKIGELEFARTLVEKAIDLNPEHPPWYDGVLFALAFQQRDYALALAHALAYRQEDSLHAHVALTAAYGQLGDVAGGSRALVALLETYPDFPQRPRSLIAEWGYPEAFTQACLDGLQRAGLANLF